MVCDGQYGPQEQLHDVLVVHAVCRHNVVEGAAGQIRVLWHSPIQLPHGHLAHVAVPAAVHCCAHQANHGSLQNPASL